MNIKNFQLNKRKKYILSGLILSTALVSFIAVFAINNIQEKVDKTYFDFAQTMTKSIASQCANFDDFDNKILSSLLTPIIENNEDISYIECKDKNNNILFSSKNEHYKDDEKTILNISAPIIKDKQSESNVENDINNNIKGSIVVGMNGNGIKTISQNTKKNLSYIFIITWLILTILFILNFLLMSKELKKLYKGVKQISTGRFGYMLESENMPELTDAFNDMSNLLSQYEEQNIEQLTLERNKLEAVLMSIINGVIVCDNMDNVVLTNSAALSMLDVNEKNFINTKIQNFVDSHGQRCFLEKIEEFKDTPLNIIEQKPIEFNIEAGKKTIKAMISPMFSKLQDYVGYIIVLIDITRETEVNKLKNTFISNVSHELRTPVTVLRTYIDTLCHNGDDFDDKTKKEFLDTIDKEAKRLHTMVNDILDFSRIESGNVCLKKEYANIVEIIEQNINSIKILADEKNISIDFNKDNKLPLVPINIESMDRVIRNLLSNAIKYSNNNGTIIVNTGISEDNKNIWFYVKDNGIGIAKEHLDKIFDRFYRIENATHTIKGTGLGLHLVKITVEKYHNGKITVESKENEGSTFKVILPLETDENDLI